ncbi:uncharacterized protein LOC117168317 [Belonocnema kinseyi]|uniref:uncharacterized protein LOC117168317 n=1 Tax=Belonocnema kinseyi TaxID=2817044 RepID=UPI00143D3455|nr:uncharacterized protein LOC117168317 [Belonocnema kinseyi]
MTLHWWSHWFWVTANVVLILANPLPPITEEPQIPDQNQMSNTAPPSNSTVIKKLDAHLKTELAQQENFRIAKAIGVDPASNTADVASGRQPETPPEETLENSKTKSKSIPESVGLGVLGDKTSSSNDKAQISKMPATKKDSKVSRMPPTTNKTSRTKYDEKLSDVFRNLSTSEYESLTVMPLQEEASRFKLVVNRSTSSSPGEGKTRTFNASADLVIEEDFTEPQIIATAASMLEAELSESTRLSRARSSFKSDFQRDQKEEEILDSESSDKGIEGSTEESSISPSVADIAIITGSCLASLALLSTVATVGFIMYRKRYLNPPQSLNSDKCSNPDSSGYIDDSTIRDNSEEMYSLDNDSFLNSLEAMTIQNYWTDSVKHTKL